MQTNQQILEKAIQQAIEGGWKPLTTINESVQVSQWRDDGMVQIAWLNKGSEITWVRELEGVIFNHQFAKALWGEEDVPYDVWSKRQYSAGSGGPDEDWYEGQMWEFHLQQMVIADDPIKYLGENL